MEVNKAKNSNLQAKYLISEWSLWRKEPSSYPLIIFWVWYLILNIMPEDFSLKLFLSLRNINMLIKRIIFKRQYKTNIVFHYSKKNSL